MNWYVVAGKSGINGKNSINGDKEPNMELPSGQYKRPLVWIDLEMTGKLKMLIIKFAPVLLWSLILWGRFMRLSFLIEMTAFSHVFSVDLSLCVCNHE